MTQTIARQGGRRTLVMLFAELGIVEGALFIMARLLSFSTGGRVCLYRYHFVGQPVREVLGEPVAGKLIVRRAEAGDPLLAELPRPQRVIEDRFHAGAVCFIAEVRGALAGCLWLAEREYREDEVRCVYRWRPSHAAWDFDVYVAPEHRMSRAFARLWDAAHCYLHARGIRFTLSRISGFNPNSLAAHRRLGATRLASATFVAAGPLQLGLFSQRPFVHISMTRAHLPKFTLSFDMLDRQN